jgi:hypothetical protein
VFVIKPNDSSPQHSKALSITQAENVHLNSFITLSTILTIGVSTSSWHRPKHERKSIFGNHLLSQSNTPGSKEMEMSFILVMFAIASTHMNPYLERNRV